MDDELAHGTFPLPRAPEAAALARQAVDSFAAVIGQARTEVARLLVSELATNAVRHGAGEITLDIHVEAGDLCVAVEDQGQEQPTLRPPGPDGGYGLRLVDQLADDWGAEEGSTHVWFILRAG